MEFAAGQKEGGFIIHTLLWHRENSDPITIDLFVRSENGVYPVSGFPKYGFVGTSLVLPDKDHALGLTLMAPQCFCFKTSNQPAGKNQFVEIVSSVAA